MPIRISFGDILKHEAEALVLPCNGSGIMGFVSLAGEVRRFAAGGCTWPTGPNARWM